MHINRRELLSAMGVSTGFLMLARPGFAAEPAVYTGLVSGVGAGAHDVVAYFTQAKPVKGSQEFKHSWNGADWYFSTSANRDLFAANPENYAPQYGGYCAYALAQGSLAKGVPEAWTVHNNKLYLNLSTNVRRRWLRDVDGYIAKADKNWPAILG